MAPQAKKCPPPSPSRIRLCVNAIIVIMVVITTNERNTALVFLSSNFTMEINE